MLDSVYLDYNATTPVKPEVRELIHEVTGTHGNPSSVHSYGRAARQRVEKAREQVGALVGVVPQQVVFNGGATEGNNAVMNLFRGQRILVSAIEHSSIFLSGVEAEHIPVTKDGVVDLAAFEKMLDEGDPPALICVMLVNNETGVIQPVGEMARLAKAKHKNVFIHCDAVQGTGRIKVDMAALQVDYMSLSAHKIGGPQGVGALIMTPGVPCATILYGGGQEKGQRAGTENVAGIAGFGLAAELVLDAVDDYQDLKKLRDHLETELMARAPDVVVFGKNAPRVANTSCFACPGFPAETQIMNLDLAGFAVSNGSACSSGSFKPNRVLQAMDADEEHTCAALRLSVGWGSTAEHIEGFIKTWLQMYGRLKEKEKDKTHA